MTLSLAKGIGSRRGKQERKSLKKWSERLPFRE